MTLAKSPLPFSHPDFLFEVKMDGFSPHAYVHDGVCELVSRSGFKYKRFDDLCIDIGRSLRHDVVLDGEIVCLDNEGRSQFGDLMFRRGTPFFYAFDILRIDGDDIRSLPVTERKRILRGVARPPVLYMDHIEEKGEALFHLACAHDLEGVLPSFEEEAEWRVVKQFGEGTPYFRTGLSTLVPYIKFPLTITPEESLKLSKLVVGPTPHTALAVRAAESLLRSTGTICPEVISSDIPFRNW